MSTTKFDQSVITSGTGPIFEFTEDGEGLLVGAGVTLSNQGDWAIFASGVIGGLRNLTATINGTVTSGPYGWAPVMAVESSLALTVGSGGRLTGAGAMMYEASRDSSLSNHGLLHADTGFGVVITDVTSSTVENWGTIYGEGGGIEFATSGAADSHAEVTNHGRIEAGDDASVSGASTYFGVYSAAATTSLVNDGTIITAAKTGACLEVGGQSADIINSGTIQSARYYGIETWAAQGCTIVNDGTISGGKGSLQLTRAVDVVTNNGLLQGTAILGGGDDVYHGENGRVSGAVWGQGGNDLLIGGRGADALGGGSGADTLTGGAGADTLTGAAGADVLSGGAGDDVFRFASASDVVGDRIVASPGAVAFGGAGVAGGDRIDLSAIDADTGLAGHQSFVFGASQDAGRLWAVDVGNVTHIRGSFDGDAAFDFDLAINDGARVHAIDYAAIDFIL